MSRDVSGAFLDRVAGPGDALRIMLGGEVDLRQRERRMSPHKAIARAQLQRVLGIVNGLLVFPLKGKQPCEERVSQREVRVQFQRPV